MHLGLWYVSPPRKCHEKLGPDDKIRWEDAVMCFMREGQLPVRNVYMYACICSAQSRNLRNLEMALHILRILKLRANLEIAQPILRLHNT